MAVYVSETSNGNLRIVREGTDVRQPLTAANTVTVSPGTPDWFTRIARDRGYDVTAPTDPQSMPDAPEVASD